MEFSTVISSAAFVMLGTIVFMGGQWSKANIQPRLKGNALAFYLRTMPLHPVIVCLLVYQVPGFPMPEGFETVAARCLLGFFNGVTTAWSYKASQRAFGVGGGADADA